MKLFNIITFASIVVLIGSALRDRHAVAAKRSGSFRTVGYSNVVQNAYQLLGQVKSLSVKRP